ncbi:hypothetical protein HYQ45_015445 [Verticillium longisporum]|uniref:Uncharacterized protein n=1 Tax=Verticillium longisporum TaxID=100787 RepID=A0A8I2Z7S8_VERLO|nr:hypothetical protein HYQ45_015445 [Verticillium longisporum]
MHGAQGRAFSAQAKSSDALGRVYLGHLPTIGSAALPEPQTNLDDPRPRNRFAHPNPPLTVPLACRSLTRFALTQSETQNTAQPTTHFHTHPTRPRQPLGELEVNPTHASYLLLPPRKAASLLVDSPRLPARPTPIMRPASACLLAPSSRPAQA